MDISPKDYIIVDGVVTLLPLGTLRQPGCWVEDL